MGIIEVTAMKSLKPNFIKNSFISLFLDDIRDSLKKTYNIYVKVDLNKAKTDNSEDAIVLVVKTTDKSIKLTYLKTLGAIDSACGEYAKATKNLEANSYGQSKGQVKNKDLQLQLVNVTPSKKFLETVSDKRIEDNFCCLVPGLPKLKRASKKFNQDSGLAKIKDKDYRTIEIDYGTIDLNRKPRTVDITEIVNNLIKNTPRKAEEDILDYTDRLSRLLEPELNRRRIAHNLDWNSCWYIIEKALDKLNIKDAKLNDVYPKKNESKEDFISRFMSETKSEYPDRKQRLAVAYSYWDNRNKKSVKDKKLNRRYSDWMPTNTPIDYIKEKLDAEGIEYEIEDDVYGETAPFDTWITITKGDDSRADDIICSVVGSAYEWVRDKDGKRRYCKVVTDEELIDEFNE